MILTKLVRNIIDMMAVAVIFFLIFYGPASFLSIRQNVCMAANAIMHCGLNRVASRRVTSAFRDPTATTRFADYSSVRRLDGFTPAAAFHTSLHTPLFATVECGRILSRRN